MKNNRNLQYRILSPRISDGEIILNQRILGQFDSAVLDFINEISERILKDYSYRPYPELIAMAFWMRKANITKIREEFEADKRDRLWVGRGIVFHIAPSNVDTIFIYSWFLSMLMGNVNIIRVSSNLNEPVRLLLDLISDIADQKKYSEIKGLYFIVQYEHNDEVTGYFSSLCDMRVIWGGDETIKRIRSIPIKPSAIELIFADKFSFSLINADKFDKTSSKNDLIKDFFNDAYWFGQNACSSPRMVVWLGDSDTIERARHEFWILLGEYVTRKLENAPAVVLLFSTPLATQHAGS